MDGLKNQWVAGGGVLDFICQGYIDSPDLLVKCIKGERVDICVVLGGIHIAPMR